MRSWSNASKVTNLKTFSGKLLAVRPKTAQGLRTRKRKRMAIAMRFTLHANAIFLFNYSSTSEHIESLTPREVKIWQRLFLKKVVLLPPATSLLKQKFLNLT